MHGCLGASFVASSIVRVVLLDGCVYMLTLCHVSAGCSHTYCNDGPTARVASARQGMRCYPFYMDAIRVLALS
jgi:hypothetical protein